MIKNTLIFLLFLFLFFKSPAGGFQVSMHSQQNTGIGLAGTSLYSSPSAIFYNPGALSLLQDNFSFSLGASLLYSNMAYKAVEPTLYSSQTDNPLHFPFYLYGSKKLGKRFTLGVGAYTPYGSSMNWDDQWDGRYIVRKVSLMTIFIQPTLSVLITKKIGIGIGVVYALGYFEQSNALPLSSQELPDGDVHLKGNARNWGFNAGILVKPVDRLSIGLNFRSSVKLIIKGGEASFSVPLSVADQFPASNRFNTTIPLPANINLGAHYRFDDRWLVTAQIDYTFWNIYDTSVVEFSKQTPSLSLIKTINDFRGNFAFRAGAQFSNKKTVYRAGAYYDLPPSSKEHINPANPCLSQLGVTAGLSVNPIKYISIDISYVFVYEFARTGDFEPYGFPGTYKGFAHIPGIGISLKF